MRYFFSIVMLMFGALSFSKVVTCHTSNNRKKRMYQAFSYTALGSAMWSLGYGLMFFTESETSFVWYRAIGIIGLFSFLIFGQVIIGIIAGFGKKSLGYIWAEGIIGIVILFLVLNPNHYIMEHTKNGIITIFTSSGLSIAYTLYTVVVAFSFIGMSIHMLSRKYRKSVRIFGRNFLVVEAMILIGMFIDTVLPALGTNLNIPASTILQSVGLLFVYSAVVKVDKNRIEFENMTGYIYRSLKSPVLVFDNQNTICVANDEARRLFDIKNEDEMKVDFWKAYFRMEPPSEIEGAGDTVVIRSVYEKKQISCKIYIDPIYDDYKDYIGYILVISDETDMVNAMREMEKSRNEAMKANEAKSLFLANMSHEIRTPMNSILGFSELALQDQIDEKSREYFSDVHDSAELLLDIINDILDFSKIESGKMEIVEADYDCAKLLNDVTKMISVQAIKKGLNFDAMIAPAFPRTLRGDQTRVREILINLLNNAVKYTNKGTVLLEVGFTPKSASQGTVAIRVKDSGIGIKKEDLSDIFESFKRVDSYANSQTEGTGLGLSITQGILRLMNGTISVSSEFGVGSEFTVVFDQTIVDSSPMRLEETVEKQTSGEKLVFDEVHVLAVDDNKVNLKVITMLMNKYNLKVETANSGKEAIEMCQGKFYDIVLMDQMMPEMDGIEAMNRIRESCKGYEKGGNCIIIALTADAVLGVRERLMDLGFDEYMSKPVNSAAFEEMFTEILPRDKYHFE